MRRTTGLQQNIYVFTNKCKRHICKVTWPIRISNEQLLERTSQEPTSLQIKKKEHDNGLDTHGESPKTTSPDKTRKNTTQLKKNKTERI